MASLTKNIHKNIIVVDDEKSICDSIEKILTSAGFSVTCYNSGVSALQKICDPQRKETIDFILLDMWMPEMDGNALLKEIIHFYDEQKGIPCPGLVVMSGHIDGNASTQLIKNGASAFLEKPFSRDQLLQYFSPKMGTSFAENSIGISTLQKASEDFTRLKNGGKYGRLEELAIPQKTLENSVVEKGVGLHTGSDTGVILSPLEENAGIIFEEINTGKIIRGFAHFVSHTAYSTSISMDGFSLTVTEHLLAALHAYSINNVKIKVNREIPILDGSSRRFCNLIEQAGMREQSKPVMAFVVKEKVTVTDEKDPQKMITIEPYDGLLIDYHLFVSPELGEQHFTVDLSHKMQETFFNEISLCRTFGFLDETRELQGNGFARGANLGNSLLLHDNKVINSDLIFNNEFARHKVLDILGDFYLLNGATLRGKITANGTGHRHNCQLLLKLFS